MPVTQRQTSAVVLRRRRLRRGSGALGRDRDGGLGRDRDRDLDGDLRFHFFISFLHDFVLVRMHTYLRAFVILHCGVNWIAYESCVRKFSRTYTYCAYPCSSTWSRPGLARKVAQRDLSDRRSIHAGQPHCREQLAVEAVGLYTSTLEVRAAPR